MSERLPEPTMFDALERLAEKTAEIDALRARVAKLEAALKEIRDIGGLGWSVAEAVLKELK